MEKGHLLQIPVESRTLIPASTTNVYRIGDRQEVVLIDAGYSGPEGLAAIRRALQESGNPTVRAIILSHPHPDHYQNIDELAGELRAPVWAHPDAAARLREAVPQVAVEREIREGAPIRVGGATLHLIEAPGHAPGHLNFHIPEDRILYTGDNVLGEGTTLVSPPDGDMAVYLQTLERLMRFDVDWLAPGHGPLLPHPVERIRAIYEHRLEREAQILALLREKERTMEEIARLLYTGQVPDSHFWLAERSTRGHLEKLLREDRVIEGEGLYRLKPS